MKGKLTDQPLAELIREIYSKNLSGTLRLEHERAQTAVYFENGQVVYAAANLRTLRLREYLTRRAVISDSVLERYAVNLSDLDLARALIASGAIRQKDVDALLGLLVSDVLRVALLWTEGTWEFNERARLAEPVKPKLDISTLLREAAQRMPFNFVSQRFRNTGEAISRASEVAPTSNLLPAESFILSRLDSGLKLGELVMLSGLPEIEARRVIYGLALSGLIKREYWQNAFRTEGVPAKETVTAPVASSAVNQPEHTDNWVSASVENEELQRFLRRLREATNYYEVIELPHTAQSSEIKEAYYAMARRYHPDRFHLKSGTKLHAEISSAFARVTQAYETLTNPGARATYDQTLQRSSEFSPAAKKGAEVGANGGSTDELDFDTDSPADTELDRADYHFREGVGALQQGRISAAIKHLSNAARLQPQEARYRAHYGRALAADENTRRLAENEIQAAVKLAPNDVTFRTMLAELYFQLKFHRRARTELDRAFAIDPKNATAHSLLRKLEKSRKVG